MKQGKLCLPQPERLVGPLLLLLLAERLLLFWQFDLGYTSGSDDIAYIQSGLLFAKTGMISIWGPYPSAMIMPGMPVLIGLFSLAFGEGSGLMLALRVLWCLMGTATAWVVYKTGKLASNAWGGLLAAAGFLTPNMAWMNHVILTETPYLLFFSLCLYYTLRLGERVTRRDVAGYVLSFVAALLFRPNITAVAVFTAAWLMYKNPKALRMLTPPLLLGALLFLLPWSLRNYRRFGTPAPLGYGAGNPLLLGTYQGEGYPTDGELDYETNVAAVMRERYAAYYGEENPVSGETADYLQKFDPRGPVRDVKYAQYLSLQADGIQARYRMREWFRRDPKGFLKSYLLIKPRWMLNWAWAWESAYHVPYEALHRLSQANMLLCVLALGLSILLRRSRETLLFLTAVYVISVYIYATAFVTDRYASTLMGLRYLIAGIGLSLLPELRHRLRRSEQG